MQRWLSWAGPPRRIILDEDGGFHGAFQDRCEELSVVLDFVAPEDHRHLGRPERHGGAWKATAENVVDQKQVQGAGEIDLLAVHVNFAKTTLYVEQAARLSQQSALRKEPRGGGLSVFFPSPAPQRPTRPSRTTSPESRNGPIPRKYSSPT
jgi:hypothetical protein